jgi:hypothetical protein
MAGTDRQTLLAAKWNAGEMLTHNRIQHKVQNSEGIRQEEKEEEEEEEEEEDEDEEEKEEEKEDEEEEEEE